MVAHVIFINWHCLENDQCLPLPDGKKHNLHYYYIQIFKSLSLIYKWEFWIIRRMTIGFNGCTFHFHKLTFFRNMINIFPYWWQKGQSPLLLYPKNFSLALKGSFFRISFQAKILIWENRFKVQIEFINLTFWLNKLWSLLAIVAALT